jgi:V/A-type H+/Na+-transporting ATPase subunit D
VAKIKLTRPELKRYRDALHRFQRYLPMLKLKQQQLQIAQRDIARKRREAEEALRAAAAEFHRFESVMADLAGISVRALAEPIEVKTSSMNVAGVTVPVFHDVVFAPPSYSLFGTPPWVDQVVEGLRELNRRTAQMDVYARQYELLSRELTRITQRVNLFEKVKIPEAQEAIRVIRIKLGDEMTAAVGRAKIAKSKLAAGMEPVAVADGSDTRSADRNDVDDHEGADS